ncbi:LysR substrate-binding domain-containing protein [Pseudochelatococcus contaminans]|uniref:LysR family glycine cleavage system transcriptional activator n=1 Tax=Pseudochelatococcus contaminans TaxID=1538103 RepID=A0A7W6EGX1_9HYPH|nr:LysR substrate-binding domain-containing protein [Pseudochelatococcus contaminans]MBB3809721.1 LysR family glycine cleavage system transcriptional activator [Pseudochelatococcus contaminans]
MNQPRKLPPLSALRAFEAAARHLSFQKAAEELAVTPTAVSHQIRLLEQTLGLPLFERHVRRVSLTAAGAHLYPVLREGLDNFAHAIAELYPQSRRKAVTVTATTLFTARRLIPALGQFQQAWPQFELRLYASDDAVDLAGGAADIAVRYGSGPFPGLVSEPLCRERFGVVCSPSLRLRQPADLREQTLIHSEWRRKDVQPDWARWCALAGITDIDVEAGLRFTDESHTIQAAIAGHGVAITSLIHVEDELSRGVLVHPFGPVLDGHAYHLVATQDNMACEDVQAVRDWLRAVTSG